MRLHNQPLHLPRTHQTTLPLANGEAIPVTLQPLPLGFHHRLADHNITPPQPPTRIARDSNHKPIRDPGGHALTLRDEQDPDYRKQLDLYHQRLAVLMIAESLQSDHHLRFDTPRPTTEDWTDYADALTAELQNAGWSDGHVLHLCTTIARISRLLDEDLTETARNFSSTTPPTPS